MSSPRCSTHSPASLPTLRSWPSRSFCFPVRVSPRLSMPCSVSPTTLRPNPSTLLPGSRSLSSASPSSSFSLPRCQLVIVVPPCKNRPYWPSRHARLRDLFYYRASIVPMLSLPWRGNTTPVSPCATQPGSHHPLRHPSHTPRVHRPRAILRHIAR